MTVINIVCWGTTILLWAVVLLRMIHNMRAARAARELPTPRRRNTGGRRRYHRTDRNGHP